MDGVEPLMALEEPLPDEPQWESPPGQEHKCHPGGPIVRVLLNTWRHRGPPHQFLVCHGMPDLLWIATTHPKKKKKKS